MSRDISNRIEYTVMCISGFAERHAISLFESYSYLKQYGGLDFLKDFYDVEHLLSIRDAVNDLTTLCQKQGGQIA